MTRQPKEQTQLYKFCVYLGIGLLALDQGSALVRLYGYTRVMTAVPVLGFFMTAVTIAVILWISRSMWQVFLDPIHVMLFAATAALGLILGADLEINVFPYWESWNAPIGFMLGAFRPLTLAATMGAFFLFLLAGKVEKQQPRELLNK